MTILLHGGRDAAGRRLDVRTDPATGLVVETGRLTARAGEAVEDCSGLVLLPAPAEPHAHLDKALSAQAAPNPAGDLGGAIAAWLAYRPSLTEEEILGRARAAALELVAHGTTAIRSHVDVGTGIGLRAVHAVTALRDALCDEGLAELQVVALVSRPVAGPEGAENRALVRAAIEAGAGVVGGAPHLDADPAAATAFLTALAAELGCPVDLHTDETLAPGTLGVRDLCARAREHGLEGRAVASHCVSLGVQPAEHQRLLAAEIAAAGVAVVALPQTNLFLQARDVACAPPRGLTAVRALLNAGALVAAGADNVRDPFNAVGRSDPLETAALLVMAAHLRPDEAWEAVSGAARRAMGLPVAALAAGAPAEILVVRGADLPDAVARAAEHRIVVHRGRVVARTAVRTELCPLTPVPVPT